MGEHQGECEWCGGYEGHPPFDYCSPDKPMTWKRIRPAPIITIPNWPETKVIQYFIPGDPYTCTGVWRRGVLGETMKNGDWT